MTFIFMYLMRMYIYIMCIYLDTLWFVCVCVYVLMLSLCVCVCLWLCCAAFASGELGRWFHHPNEYQCHCYLHFSIKYSLLIRSSWMEASALGFAFSNGRVSLLVVAWSESGQTTFCLTIFLSVCWLFPISSISWPSTSFLMACGIL